MSQFRPISCCNTVYKVISKIMTERLALCLGDIIDQAQGAFVKGRLMSDNIFLVQELLKRYNVTRETRRCFLNIDLAKAYDSVSWEFVEFALVHLGMPRQFIDWILECISTPSYSIKVNGGLHGFFKGKRGLRQGDPISPLIFVICMEMFTRLIKVRTAREGFHFHQHCEALQISHLLFADDVVFFCRGDLSSIGIIMDCLHEFHAMSGLAVSEQKSSIFLASVPESERGALIERTGFKMGTFPFRYLGIPMCPHGLRAIDYKPLVDKLRGYLSAWSKKALSFAGRLEMISSVLQGVEGFWLSILPVPRVVRDQVVAVCRNYLWRCPRVKWDVVCTPKAEGGLGLRNLDIWGKCFLLKHFWHIISMRDCLWVRWVHHRYLSVGEALSWVPHRRDSPFVKALLHARDELVLEEDFDGDVEDLLLEWCREGKFSVAAAYDAIREKRPIVRWAKEIWAHDNTPRHVFILWLAQRGRLPTYDRLWFLDVEHSCRLCGADLETHDHLFFECSYVAAVWSEVRARFLIPSRIGSIGECLAWLECSARGKECLDKARVFALSSTTYYVWHARNSMAFEDNRIPEEALAKIIITHVFRLLHHLFDPSIVGNM